MPPVTHERPPDPRQLERARARGQVAVSRPLTAALTLAATSGMLWLTGDALLARLAGLMEQTMATAATADRPPISPTVWLPPIARACAPVMLAGLVVGWLAGWLQTGFAWSWRPLRPALARLAWRTVSGRLLQPQGRLELARVLLCTNALAALAWSVFASHADALRWLPMTPAGHGIEAAGGSLGQLLLGTAVLLVAVGAVHWLLVRRHHHRQIARASHRDSAREERVQPGRLRVRATALTHAQAERIPLRLVIADADNACMLAYEPTILAAPWVVQHAAGSDAVTLCARADARGIPVVAAPTLARALRPVAPGHAIPDTLYRDLAVHFARATRAHGRSSRR